MRDKNPVMEWTDLNDRWQYRSTIPNNQFVLGIVSKSSEGMFCWCAYVLEKCRTPTCTAPSGRTETLTESKTIVETMLKCTGTIEARLKGY